ncbi:MAG: MarR family transcriptional regulator [Peptococcaceae bacterium]|nr:MarR family transcriptional regulator [Peptococcaceae bacterium]
MERKDIYITAYRLINKYNAKTKQPKTFGTAETVCGSEAQVLDVVAHEQPVTPSQIATLLGITKGAVSQTLAKLEKKALIVRSPSSDGNGMVTIQLSKAGKEILINYYAYRDCRLRKVIAAAQALPPESAAAVLQMLEAFEEALDQY